MRLYTNATERLQITSGGDVEFKNTSGVTSCTWDASAQSLIFKDDSKAVFGDGSDLSIYHSGTDAYFSSGTGNIDIRTTNAGHISFRVNDKYGIFCQANDTVKIYHNNQERFRTTGIGVSVIGAGIGNTAYIEGPSEIWIDPHPAGVGTTSGIVRIRGDLYVDGTEFIVDVDKLEIGDFQIGIASTAGTNAALDGAGIGIGSESIRKTITWNNATSALMSSDNWNLASGKHYEIAGTDVLTSTTLGSGVVNSSLTSVGTLTGLIVNGDASFNGDDYNSWWDKSDSAFKFDDNAKAIFGTSSDGLEIFHDSSHSYIADTGTGRLHINTNQLRVNNAADNEILIDATEDTGVSLYDGANTVRLATNSDGVVVTGIATATDFDSTSDIRLKTNIKPIDDPLAKVIQIEGVSFNWKENNRPALGVIADQVEEIIPELVHGDDPKTVNYNGLIGLLIEAVKEQQTQIDSLKNRLSKLE